MKAKLTITIVIIAVVLSSTACVPPQKPGGSPAPETEAPAEKSFNIKTIKVIRQDISNRLTLSGDIEASTSVDVYAETTGKLTTILVETGSWVRAGQVIAKIDPSRPGMNYAESPVKAPISGTVTKINVDPGSTVSPQMPLFTIGDISRLVITTQVPERFIYMIKKAQTAWITTTASPGQKYKAVITSISPVVNPVSRTLAVKLSLSEKAPVKAGMFVGIDLITMTSADSLTIPEKALLYRDDQIFVYRIKENRSEKVFVSTGIRNNGLVEITSGLENGDVLALEGAALLSDGSRVRVLDNEGSR